MLGFITGTGFYDYPGLERKTIDTKFGEAEILVGKIEGKDVAIICRHGENHEMLPHHINYRANILALKEVGVKAIVSFSVVGVMNKDYKLGKVILSQELYQPDNRLPSGEVCSFFDKKGEKGRGHLIIKNYYHTVLNTDISEIMGRGNYIDDATYIHSVGPRFNSKAEIRSYRNFGGDIISQTCGPEAILSGELEIPFANVCFGIDYANGVFEENTSMEELNNNIGKSGEVFENIIKNLLIKENNYSFEGFVYRFD